MPRRVLAIGIAAVVALATCVHGATPEGYRFTYRPLGVGDAASESIDLTLDVQTVLVQEGQVIDASRTEIESKTVVHAVLLVPDEGQSARARLTFEQAERTSTTRGAGVNGAEQPVAGKSYIVARQGDEIIVTDEQGQTPPEAELAIVRRSAQWLGRPNPLGGLLHGRTLKPGERLRLPQDFTQELVAGWGESLAAQPLDVILMGTQRVDGQMCALLHTPPAAPGTFNDTIQGKFLVEIQTCRVAQIEMTGPIAFSATRGTPGREFEERNKGSARVAVHVAHRRAEIPDVGGRAVRRTVQ